MSTSDDAERQPLLSKLILLFLLAMVLANIAGNMYGGLLPLYLKSLGASVSQIGLFFTLFQILPLALQILGGWISDSLGRLRSIAMGSLAGVLSYIGLILAPTWQWVFMGESLGAITHSLISPSFGAFVAEESSEENRARVFGIMNMIISIPAGWLADKKGERVNIVIGFILQFIALLFFVRMDTFLGYAVVWCLFGLGVGLMHPAYQSLLSKALPKKLRGTGFGLIQSSLGLFSLPAPYVGGQLYEKVSPRFPFIITAWVSLVTVIPAWLKFKLPKDNQSGEDIP